MFTQCILHCCLMSSVEESNTKARRKPNSAMVCVGDECRHTGSLSPEDIPVFLQVHVLFKDYCLPPKNEQKRTGFQLIITHLWLHIGFCTSPFWNLTLTYIRLMSYEMMTITFLCSDTLSCQTFQSEWGHLSLSVAGCFLFHYCLPLRMGHHHWLSKW